MSTKVEHMLGCRQPDFIRAQIKTRHAVLLIYWCGITCHSISGVVSSMMPSRNIYQMIVIHSLKREESNI